MSERSRAEPTSVPLELVTERILLSALREQDAADVARAARERAEFLAAASLRFGGSLDQELTYAAIANVALPGLDAWCIVDVIETGGGLRRLAVVHPDIDTQIVARTLAQRWRPEADDPLGIPAVRRAGNVRLLVEDPMELIAAAARDAETHRIVERLGIGPLLVVPILLREELIGAITFVGRSLSLVYSADDIEVADSLATRCAQALEGAWLYAAAKAASAHAAVAEQAAESARAVAESANATKAHFLSTMSHELRTPLNAIGGYAQLMEMGIRGPVTAEQLSDLASIRRSQVHLLGLVDAVLQYAQIQAGRLVYEASQVSLCDITAGIDALVRPQLDAKHIEYVHDGGSGPMLVIADAGKVRQILVNLLGNAIKFTPAGGRIELRCIAGARTADGAGRDTALTHAVEVSDTGPGIPADKIAAIFDPFVQVLGRELTSPDVGVGLGLAISRELARGMAGELTVASVLGNGSVFTLVLPAAGPA
ncbi:MAG: ATP-binding protein [Gemmatimonadaceae bacterium]